MSMMKAAMATKAPPNPRLARVLFRSFLRASQRGHHPEVFGRYGAAVYTAQVQNQQEHPSLALPDSPQQVRQRLKDWFRSSSSYSHDNTINGVDADDVIDNVALTSGPLEVLPKVIEQESLLLKMPSSSSSYPSSSATKLPIFDYKDVAALPGEMTQFVFIEPRYLHMATRVLDGSGQFLLRSSPDSSVATMVKLVSHLNLPNNMMAVACLGGRRVTIAESITHQVEGEVELDPELAKKHNIDLNQSNQLAFATEYDWYTDDQEAATTSSSTSSDDNSDDHIAATTTRQYILDMLSMALPLQDSCLLTTLSQFGLPPLDIEAFSFWALRYVLAPDDVSSRLYWLNMTNTQSRLQYIVDDLEAILDQQYSDEDDDDAIISSGHTSGSDIVQSNDNTSNEEEEDEEGELVAGYF